MRNKLHAICPYFAMFPESFVESHISRWTSAEDYVFDPFSGRGTTVFQSLLMGRHSLASDINPVAYCVSRAKASTPSLESVLDEVNALESVAMSVDVAEEQFGLPEYFSHAFDHDTLSVLLRLKAILNWRHDDVHNFIAALILGILHGEADRSSRYLSNQMPRTISPKPAYSVRYWASHNMLPPPRDVFQSLRREASMRLSGDLPTLRGQVVLCDSRIAGQRLSAWSGRVKCIITSPPYLNVTNFEEDQWLRLWFLGNGPKVTYSTVSKDDRYDNPDAYWRFLREIWAGTKSLVSPGCVLVARVGANGLSENELVSGFVRSVQSIYRDSKVVGQPTRSEIRRRQTDTFRPGSAGCRFEVDVVMQLGDGA